MKPPMKEKIAVRSTSVEMGIALISSAGIPQSGTAIWLASIGRKAVAIQSAMNIINIMGRMM